MKQFVYGGLATLALGVLAAGGILWSGAIDFAADAAHSPVVAELIGWARERSIARRAQDISPPADLGDAARLRRGAGNYEAMCAGCHLSPGVGDSEIRQGLYPVPPNLSLPAASTGAAAADARRFWIIKHGIKGSGMAAWARGGIDDAAIWDLAAFIKAMPGLSADEYRRQVAASGGHAHAGMAEASAPPAHAHDGHAHEHHHGH